MKVDEITGGAPYGATTIAGLGAQRQPSEVVVDHGAQPERKVGNKVLG